MSLGARNIQPRGNPSIVACLREGERLFVGGFGLPEECDLTVQPAKYDVVIRQLCFQAQASGFQVRGGGLCLRLAGCDFIADTTPQVQLVVCLQTDRVGVVAIGRVGGAHGPHVR